MSKGRFLFALLAFAFPLGLYLKTLAASYIPIDSAEFSLCMHFWGVCHPPGFPLYTLIGNIFITIWPIGTVIYKANLLSAIFSSLTVLLIYLILIESKVEKEIAFLSSLMLAVSSIFWEFSTSADVFSFATFLVALTILFVFKNKPFLAFFSLGLSASHFYISAILFPVVYWYFWQFRFDFKAIIKSIFIFVLAFFGQLLMFFRMLQNPAINWGHVESLADFFNFIRRKEFGSFFLVANPVLTYSITKSFKHLYLYFLNLATNFGFVLPILAIFSTIANLKNRRISFLLICLSFIVITQLILLSTIDPSGKDNPFQISKFYLSSFVFVTVLIGQAVNFLVEKVFGNETIYPAIILSILILISIAVNFKSHDFSKNYFSQNLVFDSLSQLPAGSVAMTVNHVLYFGGLYEQKIAGNFDKIDLLYFPNEKNRDSENYKPQLFEPLADTDFVNKISQGKRLGKSESYILDVIAKNLDKPIYILQGTFEQNFFSFLKPYIYPYGLWWKVQANLNSNYDPIVSYNLLVNLKNQNLKKANFHQKQQQDETLTYAISYHSTAVFLASKGKNEEALDLLEKSLATNPNESVSNLINLISETKKLENEQDKLMATKDENSLAKLGTNYYFLSDFEKCISVFKVVLELNPQNANNYANLGSCYALSGDKDEAMNSYQQALLQDPNLEIAKEGLKNLEK